jgi:hypothetical protein
MRHRLKIRKDGTLEFLDAPPPGLKLPGPTTRQRFSEIVPLHPALRLAFRALRMVGGEEGVVASWTRTWRCGWEATILMGPERGRRARQFGQQGRAALIEWEHKVWWQSLRMTP